MCLCDVWSEKNIRIIIYSKCEKWLNLSEKLVEKNYDESM